MTAPRGRKWIRPPNGFLDALTRAVTRFGLISCFMEWIGISGDLGGNGKVAGIDFETTGLDPVEDRIVQVAVVIFDGPSLVDSWSSVVNPEGVPISPKAAEINQLSNEQVAKGPTFAEEVEERLRSMTEGRLVVAHRLPFDASFWNESCQRIGISPPERQGMCSKVLTYGTGRKGKLIDIAQKMGIEFSGRDHQALPDAEASVRVAKRISWEVGGTPKAQELHEEWALNHLEDVIYRPNPRERALYAAAHGYQVAA